MLNFEKINSSTIAFDVKIKSYILSTYTYFGGYITHILNFESQIGKKFQSLMVKLLSVRIEVI